ncbi:MAG: serine hydrolase domain-containing protein [Halioglobus sp.]
MRKTTPRTTATALIADISGLLRAVLIGGTFLVAATVPFLGGCGSSSNNSPASAPAPAPAPVSPYKAKIADIENHLTEMEFSGAVLIAHEGQILLSEGYGLANREAGLLNMADTKFRIASLTKAFTATAILILAQRGQLQMTDFACSYISNCPDAWQDITIHHLLTHTSGVKNYFEVEGVTELLIGELTQEEITNIFIDLPLVFLPGSDWTYNNSGFVLAGLIIEKVSDTTYENFIHDNILNPLSMMSTGIFPGESESGFATPYFGAWGAVDEPSGSATMFAGSMYSTINDLYTWDQALYSDQILTDEYRSLLFTPHFPLPEKELRPGEDSIGYGWYLGSFKGLQQHSHYGQLVGFTARISRFPEDNLTLIMLINDGFLKRAVLDPDQTWLGPGRTWSNEILDLLIE